MGKQLVIPEEAGVPGENHQPWASNWLFLQKPEYPERTTGFFRNNQLLVHGWWFSLGTPASSGITSCLSMVGGSVCVHWLFLKKPEYPERTTNYGQVTGYT
jgi:hypothetical protein